MSNYPTRDVRLLKRYIPPFFTRSRPSKYPPPSLPQKVRAALKDLETILRTNPDDSEAAQLQQALRHMLAELERKQADAAA